MEKATKVDGDRQRTLSPFSQKANAPLAHGRESGISPTFVAAMLRLDITPRLDVGAGPLQRTINAWQGVALAVAVVMTCTMESSKTWQKRRGRKRYAATDVPSKSRPSRYPHAASQAMERVH